jgi:hypothetical protein
VKKARSHAGLHVIRYLGEYRIQQGVDGAFLGSGADNGAHFRAGERFLVDSPNAPHRDGIGFVWADREAAESALTAVAGKNLK